MKKLLFISLILLSALSGGCSDAEMAEHEKKAKPTFMFWCFRKEIVSADYHVPDMKTEAAAAYIGSRLKAIPGFVKSSYNLNTQTFTVHYSSSSIRYMNFEEGIAQAGFRVNSRPAKPNVKLPDGVK